MNLNKMKKNIMKLLETYLTILMTIYIAPKIIFYVSGDIMHEKLHHFDIYLQFNDIKHKSNQLIDSFHKN